MVDDLWWKTTFDGTQPLMNDDFCWKMTFKTIFDWRGFSMVGYLQCKTIFGGKNRTGELEASLLEFDTKDPVLFGYKNAKWFNSNFLISEEVWMLFVIHKSLKNWPPTPGFKYPFQFETFFSDIIQNFPVFSYVSNFL